MNYPIKIRNLFGKKKFLFVLKAFNYYSLFHKAVKRTYTLLFATVFGLGMLWGQSEQKLVFENEYFKDNNVPTNVDIFGDYAVRSATPYTVKNSALDPVIAIVYKRTEDGMWRKIQDLKYSGFHNSWDPWDIDVSINGEWLFVSVSNLNYVQVYQLDNTGKFQKKQTLHPVGLGYGEFGATMDSYGTTLVVGAPTYGRGGYIFVYWLSEGVWSEKARFESPASDLYNYGKAIAVNDQYIAVTGRVGGTYKINRFYVIKNQETYEELAKSQSGTHDGQYAMSMDMTDGLLIVGESDWKSYDGAAYIYRLEFSNGSFSHVRTKLYTDRPNDAFGNSVSIQSYTNSEGEDTKYALVGAEKDNQQKTNAGAVYIYEYNEQTDSWEESGNQKWLWKVFASDASENSSFGKRIASYKSTFLVSSLDGDYGAAYLYDIAPNAPYSPEASKSESNNSIDLSWKHVDYGSNSPFTKTGFKVYESDQKTELYQGSNTFYTNEGLQNGEVRSYSISAYNRFGGSVKRQVAGKVLSNREISGKVTAPIVNGGGGIGDIKLSTNTYGYSLGLNKSLDNYLYKEYIESFISNEFTIEAWIKPQTGMGTLFSYAEPNGSSNGIFIARGNDGKLWIILDDSADRYSSGYIPVDAWTHIAVSWSGITGELKTYINGELDATHSNYLLGNSLESGGTFVIGQDQDNLGGGFDSAQSYDGLIDEIRVWKNVRTDSEILSSYDENVPGDSPNLYAYWKFDELKSGKTSLVYDYKGNSSLNDFNLFMKNPSYGEQAPIKLATLTSDSDDVSEKGKYSFNDLYYEGDIDFVVVPDTTGGRGFNPDTAWVTLDGLAPNATNVNFEDTSVFTVRSRITFAETNNCPAQGITVVMVSTKGDKDTVMTDADGYFEATLQAGEYTITPYYENHEFSPSEIELDVNAASDGLADFEDITTRTISGRVYASSCLYPFGSAQVKLFYGKSCYSDTTLNTIETAGGIDSFAIEIPAFLSPVTILLESVDRGDWDLILEGKQGILSREKSISIDTANVLVDFVYRNAPKVKITGGEFPIEECSIAVMEQFQYYPFEFEIYEEYPNESGMPEEGDVLQCPVGEYAQITLYDNMGDRDEQLFQTDSNGTFGYTIVPASPNIVGGGYHPYQKKFQFVAEVEDGGTVDFTQWAYIEGARPRKGTFTTASPELPLLILRDPPGDGSSATVEESQTNCISTSLSLVDETGFGSSLAVLAGTEFTVGFFGYEVETEITSTIESSFDIAITSANTREHEVCLTTTTEFSTSDDDNSIGGDADVFVGAAFNIVYAITDILEIDGCNPVLSKALTYGIGGSGKDPFKTLYVYTTADIRDDIIPSLQELAELEEDPEEQFYYLSQIEVWQQTLDYNEELKASADDLEVYNGYDNFTFSGGPSTTLTFETSGTNTYAIDFNLAISTEVAFELGVDVGGVGFENNSFIRTSMENGFSKSVTSENSRAVSFTLMDDDLLDRFTMDIKMDPVYATPVFDLVSGKTQCPYEEGTLPREELVLNIDKNRIVDLEPEETAVFILSFANTSQSDEEKDYELAFLPGSNPDGARIKIGGNDVQDQVFTLAPLENQVATLEVARGALACDYDNLQVVLRSLCDGEEIADTISFDVHYNSPCSGISLFRPEDGWLVNQHNNGMLKLILTDYEFENLTSLMIMYATKGKNNWKTSAVLLPDDLGEENTIYYWDVNNIPEGEYDVKLGVNCSSGLVYSNKISGLIDLTPPQAESVPKPLYGRYLQGADISVEFDEAILEESVTAKNIKLIDLSTGYEVDVNISMNGKQIEIEPKSGLENYDGKFLKASISGISDLNDNVLDVPVEWTFQVSSNPIYWKDTLMLQTAYVDSEYDKLMARLYNISTNEVDFTLDGLPDWLNASSTTGSIAANSSKIIFFEIEPGTVQGNHVAEVEAYAGDYTSSITVEVKLMPQPTAVGELYKSDDSVTIGFEISLDGVSVTEDYDMLFAFRNDSLIGQQQFKSMVPWDDHVALMNLYTSVENSDTNSVFTFKLWDASEELLVELMDTLHMQDIAEKELNTVSLDLQNLTPGAYMVQNKTLYNQLNWISFTTLIKDHTIGKVLESLNPGNGAFIKSQNAYSQYLLGIGWVGTLDEIHNNEAYKINMGKTAELKNHSVDTMLNPEIALHKGWNWIPSAWTTNSIDSVRTSLTPDSLVLSYSNANSWFDGASWNGDLKEIEKGAAYEFYISDVDTLFYPGASQNSISTPTSESLYVGDEEWTVAINQYELDMQITAKVSLFGEGVDLNKSVLLAYDNDICVGFAQPLKVKDNPLFFLYIYGHNSTNSIALRLYDPDNAEYYNLKLVEFNADTVLGSPSKPYNINLKLKEAEAVNNAPTDILLSSNLFPANAAIGDVIAIIEAKDKNAADSHEFELVDGEGSENNGSFMVTGQFLQLKEPINNSKEYHIRLKATDKVGTSYEKAFILTDESAVAVEEVEHDQAFSLTGMYPNPVKRGNAVTLNIFADNPGEIIVQVYNIEGRLVSIENYVDQSQKAVVEIETSNLMSGLYMVRIQINGQSKLEKLNVY